MKKLVCLVLMLCLCLPALGEGAGEYLPLYQSPAAARGGETVSMSVPAENVPIAAQLLAAENFSLGAGQMFVYFQQGMLIFEHTALQAGDYCVISCRTQDEWGNAVFEFLLEQFSGGAKTVSALYALSEGRWQLTFLPQ